MYNLKKKTIVITGANRGIGLAIALRFAAAEANIVIIAKEDPVASIGMAAERIAAVGGKPLALDIDVREPQEIKRAVSETITHFGSIDVLVNNVSATVFTNTSNTSAEQFDLLISTSVRAAFLLSQACLPYLELAANPHIVNISPPLHIEAQWFKDHLAFSLCKYGMSLCTLGMAAEFQQLGIAVNSLWPNTTIATQTIKDHFLSKVYEGSRWPSIMADAAYELVRRPSRECTGHFFTDEALLREAGVVDFSHYAVNPHASLMQPLFIPAESHKIPISQDLFLAKSQNSKS